MAHDFVKNDLQIETQTGKISLEILATLLGGTLLLSSVAAKLLFDSPDNSGYLAILAAILLGAPLVWVAVKDLMSGHTHFNELVALAVLAAFAVQAYQEAAAIAFFMILSVLIENRTALGARASIESLVRITPTRAHRITPAPGVGPGVAPGTGAGGSTGGTESEIDAKDLHPGDVVRVRPGDNIPADGVVISGQSTVNQANITGESLPVDKTEDDEVFSGTINLTGMMDIRVTKAGQDTTLGRVKDLILQAERTKIPIAKMIDQYAGWYTPTILMIVGIVLFFSMKLGLSNPWNRAITMLVIACPCALILATPTAMVAALSAAARLGVLVKSVVDLEAARNLTAMIFDKTGTLTTGQLQVTRLSPSAGVDPVQLLRLAAAAEQHSRHPVARAVVDVARRARMMLPQTQEFQEVAGRGVMATVDGQKIIIGRANWLTGGNGSAAKAKPGLLPSIDLTGARDAAASAPAAVPVTPGMPVEAAAAIATIQASPEAEGLSVLFVVVDGRLLGWIGLEDNTRPEAAAAMDQLRTLGLRRLIIVTGDRESVAKRVAAQMHTDYRAEVLPQQKLEMVDELKAQGHRVAVVGDGVNDAPALAAGDASIAMGAAGSDVAIHSASIALMNNNLNRIPFLIDLSRRTSRVIKQNLIFGVSFMLVFLVLAAMGKLGEENGPIVAAMLHVFSGLVVVFNSARLVRAGEDIEHAEAEALAQASTRRGSAAAPTEPEAAAAPAVA